MGLDIISGLVWKLLITGHHTIKVLAMTSTSAEDRKIPGNPPFSISSLSENSSLQSTNQFGQVERARSGFYRKDIRQHVPAVSEQIRYPDSGLNTWNEAFDFG